MTPSAVPVRPSPVSGGALGDVTDVSQESHVAGLHRRARYKRYKRHKRYGRCSRRRITGVTGSRCLTSVWYRCYLGVGARYRRYLGVDAREGGGARRDQGGRDHVGVRRPRGERRRTMARGTMAREICRLYWCLAQRSGMRNGAARASTREHECGGRARGSTGH